MPSDVLFNNNVPAGIWDEPEENIPFNEFQDLDDYPNIQYYQPACSYLLRIFYSKSVYPKQNTHNNKN